MRRTTRLPRQAGASLRNPGRPADPPSRADAARPPRPAPPASPAPADPEVYVYRDTGGPDADSAAPDPAEPDAAYWYDLLAEEPAPLHEPAAARSSRCCRPVARRLAPRHRRRPGRRRPRPSRAAPGGCDPRSGPRRFRARAGAQARADQGPVPDRGSDRRAQRRQALRSSAGPATGAHQRVLQAVPGGRAGRARSARARGTRASCSRACGTRAVRGQSTRRPRRRIRRQAARSPWSRHGPQAGHRGAGGRSLHCGTAARLVTPWEHERSAVSCGRRHYNRDGGTWVRLL